MKWPMKKYFQCKVAFGLFQPGPLIQTEIFVLTGIEKRAIQVRTVASYLHLAHHYPNALTHTPQNSSTNPTVLHSSVITYFCNCFIMVLSRTHLRTCRCDIPMTTFPNLREDPWFDQCTTTDHASVNTSF
jgi:hypothetical protein